MKSARIQCGKEVFLQLAKLTKNLLLRVKYLSNYRRRMLREWGWAG